MAGISLGNLLLGQPDRAASKPRRCCTTRSACCRQGQRKAHVALRVSRGLAGHTSIGCLCLLPHTLAYHDWPLLPRKAGSRGNAGKRQVCRCTPRHVATYRRFRAVLASSPLLVAFLALAPLAKAPPTRILQLLPPAPSC